MRISGATHPASRGFFIALVFAAVVVGNSVYQGGNLCGQPGPGRTAGGFQLTSLGLENAWPMAVGAVAFAVLWSGSARLIEALIGLVLLMSLAFVAPSLTQPDVMGLLKGLLSRQCRVAQRSRLWR